LSPGVGPDTTASHSPDRGAHPRRPGPCAARNSHEQGRRRGPGRQREGLARDLKKALGCGATVEDGSVVLLGDLAERARDWLAARGAKRIVPGN
jgi:hypothetical protein